VEHRTFDQRYCGANFRPHRVEAIDERRIGYMTKLSVACGIAKDDAYMRSRVGYLAWLGSYTGAVPTPLDQRMADIECLWRMMLTQDS
ncbi:MAG: hypothetical protein AAFO01_11165, partial [Pseudomonadota bacterium]